MNNDHMVWAGALILVGAGAALAAAVGPLGWLILAGAVGWWWRWSVKQRH